MTKRARGILFAFSISISMWVGIIYALNIARAHAPGIDLSTTASVKKSPASIVR